MVGQRIGYVRVSSVEQNTDRQLEGLELARTFTDKASGKDTQRPELEQLLKFVREGDTVTSGQPLLRIDETKARSSYQEGLSKATSLRAAAARLR